MFKLSALGLASASFNDKWENHLNGVAPVSWKEFELMWTDFEAEYTSPNKDKDLADRKQNFQDTIERIVEHNMNSDKTYTKGINQFSDMTDEEFMAHFNLKKLSADQHCSATNQAPYQLKGRSPP